MDNSIIETNKINILNYYIGSGNIDADYVFFAIEENMGTDSDMSFYNYLIDKYQTSNVPYCDFLMDYYDSRKMEYDKFCKSAKNSNTYSCISFIYNHFNTDNKIENEQIGSKDFPLIMFGNFYPIGKPGTSHQDYPKKIQEGLGIKSLDEYKKYFCHKRKSIFKKYLDEHILNSERQKHVFTFGFEHIDFLNFFTNEYCIQFEVNDFDNKETRNNSYWKGIKNNLVIYCFYHPGRKYLLNIDKLNKIFK